MQINLGVLVELKAKNSTRFRFQNYTIGGDVTYEGLTWTFAPFSFTGVVSNLNGDNLDAGLVFPSRSIVRAWAAQALHESWVGVAKVLLLNDDSSVNRVLYSYTGVISTGGWDDTNVELNLNTVVDAVRGEIPGRRMNSQLVGNIPISAAFRV